jgi:hypothetical protein
MSEERGKEGNEAWRNDAWSLWYKKCSLETVESLNEEYKDYLCKTVNGFSVELINNLFHKKDSFSRNLLESFRSQSNGKELFLSLEEYLDEKDCDAVFEERIKKRRSHKRYYLIEALKISSDISKHYPYIMMGKLIKEFLYEKCLYIKIEKKKNGKYIIKHRAIDENGEYITNKDGSYKYEIMRSFSADELPDEIVDRNPSMPCSDDDETTNNLYAKKYALKYWESISSDDLKCAVAFIRCRRLAINNNTVLSKVLGKSQWTIYHLAKDDVFKNNVINFLSKDSHVKTMGRIHLNRSKQDFADNLPDREAAKKFLKEIKKPFFIWISILAHCWLNTSKLGMKIKKELPNMETPSSKSETVSDLKQYLETYPDDYKLYSPYLDFVDKDDLLS